MTDAESWEVVMCCWPRFPTNSFPVSSFFKALILFLSSLSLLLPTLFFPPLEGKCTFVLYVCLGAAVVVNGLLLPMPSHNVHHRVPCSPATGVIHLRGNPENKVGEGGKEAERERDVFHVILYI